MIQRFFLPRSEQTLAVERRALLEFYAADLKQTKGGTGILLFVSLLEHRAVVLADKGIAQHCKPAIFDAVVQDLIRGAKNRDLGLGYEQAIRRCSDLLQPYFPRLDSDRNELADGLLIKEY
jgi:putative membrane protein